MVLESTAFDHEGTIPTRYTCDGEDISPALSWSGAPSGIESYLLIADDPDAPNGTFVHWVYFNIPTTRASLPGGVAATGEPEAGGLQGRNGFRSYGYRGPCPPSGTHRYVFRIYALDTILDLEAGVSNAQVLEAASGHALAVGRLLGTYSR